MAEQLVGVDPMGPGDEFVSFLPLAWIGEQMVGVASALLAGFTVNFPEETATVRADIREIGPAFMMSPPRIWENMVSDVQVMAEDTTPLKRRMYRWAMKEGTRAGATPSSARCEMPDEGRSPDRFIPQRPRPGHALPSSTPESSGRR